MCNMKVLTLEETMQIEGGIKWGSILSGCATGVAAAWTLASGGGALVAGVYLYCGLMQVSNGFDY